MEAGRCEGTTPHAALSSEKGVEEDDAPCGMGFRRRHEREVFRLCPEEDNQELIAGLLNNG